MSPSKGRGHRGGSTNRSVFYGEDTSWPVRRRTLHKIAAARTSWNAVDVKFGCPPLRGQGFSGSCGVTSRNTLIHIAAMNATWSGRFDYEGMPPCRSGVPGAEFVESLATANFRELLLCAVGKWGRSGAMCPSK